MSNQSKVEYVPGALHITENLTSFLKQTIHKSENGRFYSISEPHFDKSGIRFVVSSLPTPIKTDFWVYVLTPSGVGWD